MSFQNKRIVTIPVNREGVITRTSAGWSLEGADVFCNWEIQRKERQGLKRTADTDNGHPLKRSRVQHRVAQRTAVWRQRHSEWRVKRMCTVSPFTAGQLRLWREQVSVCVDAPLPDAESTLQWVPSVKRASKSSRRMPELVVLLLTTNFVYTWMGQVHKAEMCLHVEGTPFLLGSVKGPFGTELLPVIYCSGDKNLVYQHDCLLEYIARSMRKLFDPLLHTHWGGFTLENPLLIAAERIFGKRGRKWRRDKRIASGEELQWLQLAIADLPPLLLLMKKVFEKNDTLGSHFPPEICAESTQECLRSLLCVVHHHRRVMDHLTELVTKPMKRKHLRGAVLSYLSMLCATGACVGSESLHAPVCLDLSLGPRVAETFPFLQEETDRMEQAGVLSGSPQDIARKLVEMFVFCV